jgi:hypothetical protein
MKKILFSLVGLLILAMVKPVSAYTNEPYIVIPYQHDGQTIPIPAGQEVMIRGRWGSCNKGIVLSYTNQVTPVLTVNGYPIFASEKEANQNWQEPFLTSIPLGESDCINNADYIWMSYWDKSLGFLPPGDYDVGYKIIYDHMMIDLADVNQLDKPEISAPGVKIDAHVTLQVE